MEPPAGSALAGSLARGRFRDRFRPDVAVLGRGSEDAALSILRQLATGLAALHASGVVHRDISPHNALVRSDGHAQLCDLGLARVQDAAPARALPASVPAARRLGTPGYAPAEHAGKEAARTSPAADVFALGVLLVEVL